MSAKDSSSASQEASKSNEARTEYAVVSTASSEAANPMTMLMAKLVLMLAVAALVLSVLPPFAASGFVLGGTLIGFAVYAKRKGIADIKKSAIVMASCAVFLGLVVSCVAANNAANDKIQLAQTGEELAALQAQPVVEEAPEFTLMVKAPKSPDVKSMQLTITGTTDAGIAVNDTRTIAMGSSESLGYPAGSYVLTYAAFTAPDGKTIYKAGTTSCSFDGTNDSNVQLTLVEDTAEMQRIAAEEEAARQAAKAEAEAAAAAAAEAEAAAREAAAAQSSTNNEYTVYITNTGEKYHASGCQYLRKSKIAISESKAIAQGYTPSSRCNP